jgi:hypothetical protein
MSSALCTLFEGHYHLGAAALINSVHAAGFRGRIICGYRGVLPPWAEPVRPADGGASVRDLGDGCEIWFVPVATTMHFTNFKPSFMLEMWEKGPAAGADKFFYFDPDIVVKCPWEVVERWGEDGLALCEDVNYYLPARHPLRLGWMAWLKGQAIDVRPPQHTRYYSGGFIGVPVAARSFLALWAQLIGKIGDATGSLTVLKHGGANSLFHSTDQDALNMALMCMDVTVNGTGPEGMDFAPGGHLLSHAIGGRKPWRGGFVQQALQGYPPSLAAKSFFQHVAAPIPVFTSSERAWLEFTLRAAAFIGRFHRRA